MPAACSASSTPISTPTPRVSRSPTLQKLSAVLPDAVEEAALTELGELTEIKLTQNPFGSIESRDAAAFWTESSNSDIDSYP